METPSLNDRVAAFPPMSKREMGVCNGSIIKEVQRLADSAHHFKIKSALGLPAEESLQEYWLTPHTERGQALVERLDAVDVPISQLFTAICARQRLLGRRESL